MHPPSTWTALLIGGNSAAGKSTVARELSLRLGVPWYQVDDFRLVLERMLGAEQHPVLHTFEDRDSVVQHTPEALVQRRAEIATLTSFALEKVIDSHVATNVPVILEGDDITPTLATRTSFAGSSAVPIGSVRSVFVIESDPEAIRKTMLARGLGFERLSADAQTRLVQTSHGYGAWLVRETARHRLATIAARPWDTLAGRILRHIDEGDALTNT